MSKPAIVQSDNTILLEVENPAFEEARDAISPFAELEKSPEHVHTYRITPLSLWNAASSGLSVKAIAETLIKHSRYIIPDAVLTSIKEQMSRYGLIRMIRKDGRFYLVSEDSMLLTEIVHHKKIEMYIDGYEPNGSILVKPNFRGHVKQALIKAGFPVEDIAGYDEGDHLETTLRTVGANGNPFGLRDYQESAINAFHRGGGPEGGSGVIVLPCGAGKTIVGIGVVALLKTATLILVTNTVALRQWRDEFIDKTDINPELIGEFSGEKKEVKPITIATYNILTYRKKKGADFEHFSVFSSMNWGLIIYDEVHLLPAPVFRMSAEIQSKRRLGLTATLVREDGMETDVFSLIGPKKYDIPWKVLEKQHWIAEALCTEIRVALPDDLRYQYSAAGDREKFRIASENPEKSTIIKKLLAHHVGARVLIIGQYIAQLQGIAAGFGFPLITGATPTHEREELYYKFKTGEIQTLIVSKVANFSIDLPDANVAIQVSGTFGSRQEEAQRLGRILRPKSGENRAFFYTVITQMTAEEKFAHNRQLFLTEQGYTYVILNEKMFIKKFS